MTADSDSQPDPPAPTGADTTSSVLQAMSTAGFTAQLQPGLRPGSLRCSACGSETEGDRFDVLDERRLEGASDPDDMVLIVGARCPVCSERGTIVLGYGPEASPEDSDIVLALSRP